MKKYPGIILAAAASVMITSCSPLLGGNTKTTGAGADKEAETTEAQTDLIKIENETDPEPSSEPETTPEAETEAAGSEEKPGETEAVPVYSVTAVKKTMYVTQPVHVRASYTTKSDVLTSFGTGRKVSVTGQSANGWMRISYSGGEAYIYKKYLSEAKPKNAAESGNGAANTALDPTGESTSSGQSGTNSSNSANTPNSTNTPTTPNTSTTTSPTTPAGTPSGSNESIPIVEPSPLTPSAGMQNTNSTAGPGSTYGPGSGTGSGIITSIGPGA